MRADKANMMKFKKYLLLLTLATLTLGGALTPTASAAPKAEAWPRWQASDEQSEVQIDHSAWGKFLLQYLVPGQASEPNRLRYAAVAAGDKAALVHYLDRLTAVPVTKLKRAEQKVYWINLYNALTVNSVLDHYPLKSIRDIKSGWFSAGPWDLKLIRVEGIELTLNDIEHRILRPLWQDNRVHYALNCASLGCPNLQPEPFTAKNSEYLLEQAARDFINSPRGVHFDEDSLVLSSIYDWFQADFGADEIEVIKYLQTYASPALAEQLRGFHGTVSYQYDWNLNGI